MAKSKNKDHQLQEPTGTGLLLPGLVQERHKLYAERLAALRRPVGVAQSTMICNASTKEAYQGDELKAFASRPGSMDAYALPSLVNGRRIYPKVSK